MNMYDKVLEELTKLGITYGAYESDGIDDSHAFLDVNNDKYSIEVVDHGQTVEVNAFRMEYRREYEEVTYFRRHYKTVNGAVRRIKELIEKFS